MLKDEIQKLEQKLKTLCNKPNKGVAGREKVDLLNRLGDLLHQSNPLKSESYARKAFTISKTINYKSGMAESYRIRGLSCYPRGHYDKAQAYYSKSLRLYEQLKAKKHIADVCYNIGAVFEYVGEYSQALEYGLKALQIKEKIRDKDGIAQCCNHIGLVYNRLGAFRKALKYHLRALKIGEKRGNKRDMGNSYNNICYIYWQLGDFTQALKYQRRALRIFKETDNRWGIASCLNVAGIVHAAKKNYDKALYYFIKSTKQFERIGDKNGVAIAYSDLGQIYEDRKEFSKSLKYYRKSLDIFDEIGSKRGIAHAYSQIGNVQIRLGNYDVAYITLEKSLKLARNIESKRTELDSLRGLYLLYREKNDYEKALCFYAKFHDIKEEMFNAEKSKQMTEMRTKYETERKEKEAEIHRLKNVELRKEIRERKKAEKELNKHRKHLERMVRERTAQLRSLTHELSLVEEKQRRKIATYLHDEISQKLALVAFKLESLQERSSHGDKKAEFDELMKILDQTTQRIRSLTFEISPPILYELGFEPAVEWLLENFGKQYGIRCKLKDDGEIKPMTDDTRVLLFQSVRELLVNIAKHAQAQDVKVTMACKNHTIQITVKDNGRGFNMGIIDGKIKKSKGFGLFSIKERLDYLNGSMKIRSKVGKGTTVSLQAPLERTKKSNK